MCVVYRADLQGVGPTTRSPPPSSLLCVDGSLRLRAYMYILYTVVYGRVSMGVSVYGRQHSIWNVAVCV